MGLIPQFVIDLWNSLPATIQYLTIVTWKILFVMIGVILVVAFSTYFERKVIGSMQSRIGPNRVGPLGLGQPFADVIKLLCKEVIIPAQSNRFLFIIAPLLSLTPALAAWAVIPMNATFVIADINAGLLYVLALTSVGVYGVILAGWATNSKYAFLGAMRSAAQIVAYEIAMGFALVGVLMAGGSLNIGDIIEAQSGGFSNWFLVPLFPLFLVYWISGVAETNRAPFDVAEGESEIVAGYHVEYSGVAFAIFFLAEYANMVTASALAVTLYFGGYHVPGLHLLGLSAPMAAAVQVLAFMAKVAFFLFLYVWVRWTVPRFRYDQLMDLGWKVLIELALLNILWVAFLMLMGWA